MEMDASILWTLTTMAITLQGLRPGGGRSGTRVPDLALDLN
jgi:hypothetical protein